MPNVLEDMGYALPLYVGKLPGRIDDHGEKSPIAGLQRNPERHASYLL